MDDWTDPYPNSDDLDLLLSQPVLLDEVWGAVEDRLRVARAGAAAQAEAPRVGTDIEQSQIWDSVDDGRDALHVPLPFATPPGVALTF
ncbi:hypothetical protein TESS_TESS_01572 [Tessaracoccus sp. O5.2]|uniref:hypothetical protein n=1 Tax=Tessaracoccus sp. O5.2 TaxID=3157622 RepID=UPI0035EFA3E5